MHLQGKLVVTRRIPSLSTGKVVQHQLLTDKSSYNFQRHFASGSLNNVQLSLTDNTVGEMHRSKHCESLNQTNTSTNHIAFYMNYSRTMLCINDNTLSSGFYIDSNNDNCNADMNRTH